jgi:hypothetical protein
VFAFIVGMLADHVGLGPALMILALGLIGLSPLYVLKMDKNPLACGLSGQDGRQQTGRSLS